MSRIPRGLLPVLATLLLLALGWTVSLRQVVQVRADMADLLPPGGTPAARLLARELRSGPASSLLIVALEGAEPEHLARVSRALADGMRRSGRFGLVANGAEGLDEGEREFLFRHRYLLSPATTPDASRYKRLSPYPAPFTWRAPCPLNRRTAGRQGLLPCHWMFWWTPPSWRAITLTGCSSSRTTACA